MLLLMPSKQVAPIRHCGLDPQSPNQQMIVFGRFHIMFLNNKEADEHA